MTDTYTLPLLFLIGLCVGSFLNVCIYRMPYRISVLNPRRSFCPQCERELSWFENIPVVSWLIQGAKCKGCSSPISGQYPLVELLGAFAAVGSYLRFGPTPTFLVILPLVWTLIVVTFIDLEHKIIPDRITKPGATIGLLLGIASEYTNWFACSPSTPHCLVTQGALDSLVGALIGSGFFWVIAFVYERITKVSGLGLGDVKLLMMTGAVLGVDSVFPTIVLGSTVGAVIGVFVMIATGQGRKTEIPFGPFLALGALLYLFSDTAAGLFHSTYGGAF